MKEDYFKLDNPKAFFGCKASCIEYAEGLDCQIKYEESKEGSRVKILSNYFKRLNSKESDEFVERSRASNVLKVKEKIHEELADLDQSLSNTHLDMLDEATRANRMMR